jgi:hypothetical protein
MDDLVHLDEEHWQVRENMNHIELIKKYQRDDKNKTKSFEESKLVLWLPKATKIKGRSLSYHGKVHIKYRKHIITTWWSSIF